MNELELLARDLGVSVWTLRRAIATGLVRARRPGPRKIEIDSRELSYLLEQWPLLTALRAALRTEQRVRLAVLYGSQARGTAVPDSDVDLLVELSERARVAEIEARLSDAIDRTVSLSLLDDIRRHPIIHAEILRDGRVVVDRASLWPVLTAERRDVLADARRDRLRMKVAADAALVELAAEAT